MKKEKVIVIGLGIVGACCSYFAARSGFKVEAFDMGEVGKGTTDATGSFVAVVTKKTTLLLNLALRSRDLYEKFKKDLGIPYWVNGSYMIFRNIKEESFLNERADWIKKQGIDVQFVTKRELKKLFPDLDLNEEVKGALYTKQDAGISSKDSCITIVEEAVKNGVLIRTNSPIKGFHIIDNKIKGVITSQGIVESEYVVLAAGPWSSGLANQIGLKIPIELQKGETLITDPVDFTIKGEMLSAEILIKKLRHSFPKQFDVGMAVSQNPDRSVKIGATREWADFDFNPTERGRVALLEEVKKYFPSLSNLHIRRQVVGFRAFTKFNRPFICKLENPEGLILACGHGGDGIALAPITGWQVSQILLGNKTEFDDQLGLE